MVAIVTTSVWQPVSLKEANALKKEFKQNARFIAGGTLMQLQREQGIPFPLHLISLEQITELKDIEETKEGFIRIGALASLETCRTHPAVKKSCPVLSEALNTVASPAVRNRGTIGGNVLYQIGDAIPILLALDARISWFCENGKRTERLSEYISGQSPAAEEAILTDIIVPPQGEERCFTRKIGRREAFTPSVVTVALKAAVTEQQEIQSIRIVTGGGLNTPRRLTECENWLVGKKLSSQVLDELAVNIKEEAVLMGDAFASADYRSTVAANLIVSELR